MATKRSRRTIGANPLDSLSEGDVSAQTKADVTDILNEVETAETTEGKRKKVASKPIRRASGAATRSRKGQSVDASSIDQDKVRVMLTSDAHDQAATDDDPNARDKKQVEDAPQTAEALFDAECSNGHDFSPRRELVKVVQSDARHKNAMAIVRRWSQWSVAAGVVPVPLLDNLAISGVQLKMVHDLCRHYGVKFEKEASLAIVGSLVGGAITTSVTDAVTHVLLKSVPYAEQVLQPTLSFATTYSLGYVFVKHFEQNGTLKDFKVNQMRGYFQDQLQRTKSMFSMRKQKAAG